MRFSTFSALAMASTVSGHALMYGVWVNGEDQGDGQNVYIRTPPNNSPVKDLTSSDIVCNVNGAKAAPEFVQAAAGDTLSFEWYHNTRDDDIIDGSHQGPIITWIAEYTEGDGTGPIWSKIAEDGFDGSKWAVDKLKANNGKNDFVLPSSLAAGKYLIRQEIIAHHESDSRFDQTPARGAQFYPSCVQFEISGSGSTVPDQGFDFNVDYTYDDPGILFNLYSGYTSYSIPGPEVFSGSGSGGGNGNGGGNSPDPTTTEPAVEETTAATAAPTAPTDDEDASSTASVVAPSTTLATVINTASSVPSGTETATTPSRTASPPNSCSSRRRRRRRGGMKKRGRKNVRKNVM